jgi:threonine dehydrogenase-like Zn-dependent dehydrogenase
MKAVCWWGKTEVRVVDVPDPEIINPHDAIVRVTLTAICGSDLHLYDGYVPTMMRGDILGHEFMGEVVEVGGEVKNLKPGDRVIVPFPIACGRCWFCENRQWSLCDNTNPNAWMIEALMGYSGAGLFGYSHMYGGYAGGQAQYVRVPFADVSPLKIPDGIPVSIPGVYAGFIDKVPFGTAFGKGLTLKMGQTHVQNYTRMLLERIERGEIDPSFIITHRVALDDAPEMYRTFRDKQDDCVKVVMRPAA